MQDYPWIVEAKKHVGLKEIPGPVHNKTILKWLTNLGAWWSDDETPWCGVYTAHCFKEAKLKYPKFWMRARAWADNWGEKIDKPVLGCVVVFERQGGGHVGFVTGINQNGRLIVLGGNQSNMVNYALFDTARVVGYYMPKDYEWRANERPVPIMAFNGPLSVNEA